MEKEIQIPDGFEAKIEGNKVIFVPKESYDEKVRKTLLRCCDDWDKGQLGLMAKEDVPAIRAYLEKQKDSNKAMSAIEKIDKYIDSHTANAHDMDDSNPDKKYYSGVDDTLSDIAGILTDCYTNFDGKKWIREKDYHDQLDAQYAQGFEDGRKEQKPAELSEEDEKWFKEIELMALYFSNNTNYREKFFNWLNSLHERFNSQSKQEWSDEDKKKISELKTFIAQCNGFNKENRKKAFDMIDALCPRPNCKPGAEWSEEDKKMLKDTIREFYLAYPYAFDDENPRKKNINWLKNLEERFDSMPKQEWSEEDENMFNAICYCASKKLPFQPEHLTWLNNRVKRLRPQSHWKPSEEQMEVLSSAAENTFSARGGNFLQSLYNDLKKL